MQLNKLDKRQHSTLCGWVASLLLSLKWRHTGLGALQAYILEGEEHELRVHIWHPFLQTSGIKESGAIHDHRFHMYSTVLLGSLTHVEYELTEMSPTYPEYARNCYQKHAVTHARKAMNESGTFDSEHVTDKTPYMAKVNEYIFGEGISYFFPKRHFHRTDLSQDLTVTLVRKFGQDNIPASVVTPYGVPPVHAFGKTLSPDDPAVLGIVEDARRGLNELYTSLGVIRNRL